MAGVHRSLQFPSLSAQPSTPASALHRQHTHRHTPRQTDHHLRAELRIRSRGDSRAQTHRSNVRLYKVLNSCLDNMLTVSDISTPTALLLLPSALRMINEHSAPLWSPLLMKHLVSSVYTSLIFCPMTCLNVFFLCFLQLRRSILLKRTNSMQHRRGGKCTVTATS